MAIKGKKTVAAFNDLLSRVKKLVKKEWTVQEFDDNYYFHFLDASVEDFDEEEFEFFKDTQEALDWVRVAPTKEERRYGLTTYEEFIDWVDGEYRILLKHLKKKKKK